MDCGSGAGLWAGVNCPIPTTLLYLARNIHTYIPLYIYTAIHTYMHTGMHMYIPICLHACMNVYPRTYLRTYIPTYLRTHIHIYVQTCLLAYLHTGGIHRAYLPIYLPASLAARSIWRVYKVMMYPWRVWIRVTSMGGGAGPVTRPVRAPGIPRGAAGGTRTAGPSTAASASTLASRREAYPVGSYIVRRVPKDIRVYRHAGRGCGAKVRGEGAG